MTGISTESKASKPYTPEEYLSLEVKSEIRHEYRNGQVITMTGGTPDHNELVGALFVSLRTALRGQPYRVFFADQRLWIPELNMYTYPDVMVLPRPIQLQPGRQDTVINPLLIAEVLSPSTQTYDRGDKFMVYRTISRFQEYLLIDQTRLHIDHWTQQSEQQWLLTSYCDPSEQITLSSLGVDIPLSDLYENIEFSEP